MRDATLWQMLVWTYRDQLAQRYLKRPMDWFLWRIAVDEMVEGLPRASVHPDAAIVHAAVCEMPQEDAEIVVYFAEEARQPEPPTQMPAPRPFMVSRSDDLAGDYRIGQTRYGASKVEYLVRRLETVAETEPVFRRFGRRMKQVGTQVVKRPVEYCPVDWYPSPDFVIATAATHVKWVSAMTDLYATLRAERFRDHALEGMGITHFDCADVAYLLDGKRIQEEMAARFPPASVAFTPEPVTVYRGEDERGEPQVEFLDRRARVSLGRRSDSPPSRTR